MDKYKGLYGFLERELGSIWEDVIEYEWDMNIKQFLVEYVRYDKKYKCWRCNI